MKQNVVPLESLSMADVGRVGGKNASLGEMISGLASAGVKVPGGFATTADAYYDFLSHERLAMRIDELLDGLDVDDVKTLAATGATIRQWLMDAPLPGHLEQDIREAYAKLCGDDPHLAVAVRSSATAEDLPDASFAGQQETFLNVRGIDEVLAAVRAVYASLYNDRAIAYRVHSGYHGIPVALSAGVQRRVRSECGSSGVMFMLDTESGFRDVVFITSAFGLGETVVQGQVNPDEFYVYKPALAAGRPAIVRRERGSKALKMVYGESAAERVRTIETSEAERLSFSISDEEVEHLARAAMLIEQHYDRPMDIEWARDGIDGGLYIVQARPETVQSREGAQAVERFVIRKRGEVLSTGRAIGSRIGAGRARLIMGLADMAHLAPGDVLVTDMTDPNWEPVMKRASAIVTNRGGRTCHAAIIARELGIPAIVGCGNATEVLDEGDSVTVSCAEGDTGYVYRGKLDYEVITTDMGNLPDIPVKIMMNVGNPELAFEFAQIPNGGVGLARLEFVINNMIGIHPKAILELDQVPASLRNEIMRRSRGYLTPKQFFIEKIAEGVATLAAAFYPNPVIVRLSDFKSNEYRKLLGGEIYEPEEENPMLGFRGASRYIAHSFRDCFEMECIAMKKVRNELGLTNVQLMVPFVRNLDEAKAVVDLLGEHGLKRGEKDLKLIMMCEIPSNAILAEQFLEHFDGFSIGSNDLTQLTLGLDRDSGLVAHAFDERDPAVKQLLSMAIQAANKLGKYVGICGQGPSDHADFAEWLMDEGIQTISLNPDTVVDTWLKLAAHGAK
ncbi:MAG: phosphoenolpyruvate synthase [Rhodocyclaceae bacterium]|nr:phosphoenolpyruvate synthase [Rhodocyclaceae bacterium]